MTSSTLSSPRRRMIVGNGKMNLGGREGLTRARRLLDQPAPGPTAHARHTLAQLDAGPAGLDAAQVARTVVAYEPVFLHGGSVTAATSAAITAQPDIDGALVDGASLDPEELAAIWRAARTAEAS